MNSAHVLAIDATRDELESALARLETLRATLVAEANAPPAPAPPESPAAGLVDEAAWKRFFDYVRTRPPLGPELNQLEVDGCRRILTACAAERLPASWAAYVLATAYHETAGQLRPIPEIGKGKGRKYGERDATGQIPYGRGDVQLTWSTGYARADRELGLNGALVENYDLALDPEISAKILVRGMSEGWFTGKRLNDRIGTVGTFEQFKNARVIVNGRDRDELIAGYAITFQEALKAAGWR